MAPEWLDALAKASVVGSFFCAGVLLGALWVRPRKMAIMNLVWPVTALYWGPVALWAWRRSDLSSQDKPFWEQTSTGVTHCGAGCTLGDIAGEWMVYAFGWTLFGDRIYAEYFVDFGLAFTFGIVFQYFSIAPMRGLGLKDGIVAALKADTASIIAFEIGLFGWMAIAHFLLFPQETTNSWNHWFMMQIGMIIGFITCYPANWVLLRKGLKEPM